MEKKKIAVGASSKKQTASRVDKIKHSTAITFIVFLAVVFLITITWSLSEIPKGVLSYGNVFSISADIIGMSFSIVLVAVSMMDEDKKKKSTQLFITLVFLDGIAMFWDALSWIVDKKPNLIWLNYTSNMLMFTHICVLQAFFFWYVLSLQKSIPKWLKAIDIFIKCALAFGLLIVFTTPITGFLFSVDADGVYHRGPFYFLSVLFTVAVVSSIIVVAFKIKQGRRRTIAIICYVTLPVIAMISSIWTYGVTTGFQATQLALLIVYSSVYLERGSKISASEADLNLAKSIQFGFLPNKFPESEDYKLFAMMDTAKEVGGDFYDFYQLDDDNVAITVADVSGKGIPAALFMVRAKTMLKEAILKAHETGLDLGECFNTVNQELAANNPEKQFVTVWTAVVNIRTGHVRYANAGHCKPLLRLSGEYQYLDMPGSLVMGIFKKAKYKTAEFDISKGDLIYQYTDGVTEAMSLKEELFGEDRIIAAASGCAEQSPQEICKAIRSAIADFTIGAEQFDDITMISIQI